MKFATAFLFAAAIIMGGFGYWGYFTRSGGKVFEEMAGMIPFFALCLSVILFAAAAILGCIFLFRKRLR